MRLAILAGSDLRFFGGGERWIIEFCKYVKRRYGGAVEIDIYSVRGWGYPLRVSKEFIKEELRDVAEVYWPSFLAMPLLAAFLLAGLTALMLLARLRRYDVVLYMMGRRLDMLLALLLLHKVYGKRVVIGFHSPLLTKLMRYGARAFRDRHLSLLQEVRKNIYYRVILRSLTLKLPTAHVINTRQKEDLVSMGYKGSIYYIPYFYPFNYGKINSSPQFICLFVARLDDVYHKGLDLLVKVVEKTLARNTNITFYVIGSGANQHIVEDLARKYPENVKFLGFISDNDELLEHYSKGSLFISTSRFESFGLVLIEALFNGVPVIAFAGSEGPEDIIREELFGKLIPAYNIDKYVDAIIHYYEMWAKDPDGYMEMRKKIAELVKSKYSKDAIIPKIMKMLVGSPN